MGAKGQSRTGGRKKGTPNRATREFRDTVTTLLERNAENVSQWLQDVAEGNKEKGLKPDPARALDLMSRLAEYSAPKLARVEHMGPNGGDIPHTVTITHVKPERSGS